MGVNLPSCVKKHNTEFVFNTAHCASALPQACAGITFKAPTQAPASVLQVYVKNASSPPPGGGPAAGQQARPAPLRTWAHIVKRGASTTISGADEQPELAWSYLTRVA